MLNNTIKPHLLSVSLLVLLVSAGAHAQDLSFKWNSPEDPYLVKLHRDHHLDDVISGKITDLEKVQTLSSWVRGRWKHNGMGLPKLGDPISILEEAAQGGEFRGVESAVVMSGVLNSIGIQARVVGLMTAEVETAEAYAGHVVTEAYLRDRKTWMMIDPQWDAMPMLNGSPISVFELQKALASGESGLSAPEGYFEYIRPYLHYFNTKLDTRLGTGHIPYNKHSGSLMVVPKGAAKPKVFQKIWPLRDMIYTESAEDFYPNDL